MVDLTTLLGGGVDYYQESTPSSAKEGEIWLPINETEPSDPTIATGVTEEWSHNLHSDDVNDVDESNDNLYSASTDGTVKAVNTSDGSEIWSHNIHNIGVSSVFVSNDVIFSGDFNGNLVAANISDGSENFSTSLSGDDDSISDIFVSSGVVYSSLSFDDNKVIASDTSDGSEIWSHSFHNSSVNAVHASDGAVYSCEDDSGTIVAADASDGSQIWSTGTTHDDNVNDIYVSNDVVYSVSGAFNEYIVAQKSSDGSTIWSKEAGEGGFESVHVKNNVIYAGSRDIPDFHESGIHAYDTSDGSEFWSDYSIHTLDVNQIDVDKGIVYSCSTDNTVKSSKLDGVTYIPVDGGAGASRIYFDGSWVEETQ